jgi:hypothetical protein
MIKSPYPESPIFGNHSNPEFVCNNLKNHIFYVFCLKNGKMHYDFVKFSDVEISILLSGYSAVKYGRHWWL